MWSHLSNSPILRELRSNRRNTFITVTILGCLIISFFFSYAAFGKEGRSSSSLLSVHILFRHGDRTPTFYFPKDPYFNRSWPDGNGALTNKGKHQMYLVGKLFRSVYSDFLPELYNSRELVVKSSSSPRCQMSAATLLAGLYPPVGSQIWNKNLLWQPIPVNPIPRDRDNLIIGKVYCPAFTNEKRKSDLEIMNELTSEEKSVFDYASEHTGIDINDIGTAETLYYTLYIEKDNGLKLPAWTSKVYPEPLRTIAAINLASYTRTQILKRLQSGPLLTEWLSNIESYQNTESPPLMYLYSGHDLTLVNTMRSLGLMVDYTWLPEYGASLILELHQQETVDRKSKFYVKFLYLNSSSSETLNELKMENCAVHCPLDNFKTLLKPLIPEDWQRECN